MKGATRSFNVVEENTTTPEELMSFVSDMSQNNEAVAQKIAGYLWEPKVNIINKCLICFSREQIVSWLQETIETEKTNGMQTLQGQRRKSPGGVFFSLVSSDASEDQRIATVGLPRVRSEQKGRAKFRPTSPKAKAGDLTAEKVKFTPLEVPQPPAEHLEPARAKRNPFALNSAPTRVTPVFNTSEDLGEALPM